MLPENNNAARYAYLDGWRGLSILGVLLAHFFGLPGLNTGRLGVEMFFVLSGRLMAEILFVKDAELSTFFKRRISRVWPALFVFILLAWLVLGAFISALKIDMPTALSCLTFTYNYMVTNRVLARIPTLDHMWSLCIEEHIYLFLGLTAYLSRRFRLNTVVFLTVVALGMIVNGALQTYLAGLDYYNVYWRTDVRGASIIIGVIAYLVFSKRQQPVPPWLPIGCFVFAAIASINKVPDPLKYSFGTLSLAIAICSLDKLSPKIMNLLTHPALKWIGLVSFSVYLWQQPFFILKDTYPSVVLLPCAIVMGIISYFLIEVPARKYLNQRWANKAVV